MAELSNPDQTSAAVVYLSWLPYGIELFQQFIHSYRIYPAGYKHKLIIVFNGLTHVSPEVYNEFLDYANEHLAAFEHLEMSEGQDIDAYFFAAGHTRENVILFLNSFSNFSSTDWLKKYLDVLPSSAEGLVGATASNQSLYNTVFDTLKIPWEFNKAAGENFSKYKMLIKAFFYWRLLIPRFPNPHIRTTGFLIGRRLFLSIKRKNFKTKFDAYLFESGNHSLTNQVLKRGYDVMLVDKVGRKYEKSNWIDSNTFWIGDQENLLIKDNQTHKYESSNDAQKKQFTFLAWGITK